ncbi:acyltransferase family protein [Noviherbaspirillum galbum]|uniref:Acyltransferase n=1 Tax=Noviherbaspirillum galbum TaxID=2709383 RepID=A0A6B3SMK6_9BURK|nr:acyltransferase [Noviherbaspirillum galbum]NEX61963.1 acyltransferase [Noviherbaspirillum galbum]
MIKSLEGLRGIAAVVVALYHLKIGINEFSAIRHGYLFVDLFFVLSGFVISKTYASRMQDGDDFRLFIARRIGRLLPLLLFSTLAVIVGTNMLVAAKRFAIASGHAGMLGSPGDIAYLVPSLGEIVSTVTFTHALGLFDHLVLNGPTWSISTEFYTYLLFAAICLIAPERKRLAVFAILSIAGLLLSIWASVVVHHCIGAGQCLALTYDFGFVRCLHAFFLGVLTQACSQRWRFDSSALQVSIAFLLFLSLALVGNVSAAAFAFPAAFAVLVLSLGEDTGPLADTLKLPLFQQLGLRSYSIYLMHEPLLLVFGNPARRATGILSASLVVILYVAALYVVSGWTYRWIEKPYRDRINRLTADSTRFGRAFAFRWTRRR